MAHHQPEVVHHQKIVFYLHRVLNYCFGTYSTSSWISKWRVYTRCTNAKGERLRRNCRVQSQRHRGTTGTHQPKTPSQLEVPANSQATVVAPAREIHFLIALSCACFSSIPAKASETQSRGFRRFFCRGLEFTRFSFFVPRGEFWCSLLKEIQSHAYTKSG